MGGSASKIPQAQLDVYVACTCLSESEILLLLSKYEQLGGSCPAIHSAERQYTHKPTPAAQAEVLPSAGEERPKVSMKLIISQNEFANNPFASSLCKIFSTVCLAGSHFVIFKVSSYRGPIYAVLDRRKIPLPALSVT